MHQQPTHDELEQEVKNLRAQNNTLSQIIESNPHGIALIDNNGQYLYLNSYFTVLTGYTLEDIPSKKIWFEKAYPDKQYRKHIVQVWTSDKDKDKDKDGMSDIRIFKIMCKDGHSKQIEFRTTFLNDQTISVLTDVTKQKEVEDALRESKERLKAIFETNPDPVVVYDAKGNALYLNASFIRVFGWSLEEMQSKQIVFLPENQKVLTRSKIKEIYETGKLLEFETKRFSKDGKIIDIALSAAIMKDYKGIRNGLVVNLKDLTKIKKLENQLQHAQRMEAIGTLAGGIAHDFNNILFPIMGNTEILLMDTSEDSETHKRLQKVYKGAHRAKNLVNQILTFSRQTSVEFQTVKLQPIINETLDFIRSAMPTNIEIKRYISTTCWGVKADPTQIHQIIMNLTTNASYALGKKGGQIKVNLKEVRFDKQNMAPPDMVPGTYIYLSIADTGIGMDDKLIKQIFDPFFTTKEKSKGTGMGLSIVHGIVKKMNGFIKVTSEPGSGSKFDIYFPETRY